VFRRAAAAATIVLCTLLGASASQAKNPSPGGQDLADVTAPSISGTAAVGATMTGDPGTWTGPGVKFSLQWVRCDSSGGSCQSIQGATSSSYAVGSGDVGQTLRFQVVASNHSGSMSAVSDPTAAVVAATTGDTQAPSAPASVTVTATTVNSVGISWPASTDNVAVTGYDVYKNGVAVSTSTVTSATLSGLSCGTSYTVGVDAYDAAGNHSAKTSATVSTSTCPVTTSTQSSIYWGAYIEGTQTYNYQ
jgi:Fibronectin type III domain/Ig domain of plant-specific actin-binding protein